MTKPVRAASVWGSGSRALVLTLSVTLATAAQSLAAPAPQSPAATTGYCQLVKNATARDTCVTGRKLFYGGSYRAALVAMKQALQASPKEGVIHVMIARIMSQLGDDGSAERELRQARKDGVPDDIVLRELSITMIKQHREILLLNEFAEPAPDAKGTTAAAILDSRALALLSLKRLDESASAMDRSLSLQRNVSGLLDRTRIADRQNNPLLAYKLTTEALALEPQNPTILVVRLKQVELSNDAAATLAISDRILKQYPTNNAARGARIRLFLKQNQDGKAKSEIDAFMAVAPNAPLGRFYQAVLLSRAHDRKGAAKIIGELPTDFVSYFPEFAVQMSDIAFQNGDAKDGFAILQDALAVAPDLLDIRLQLASQRLRDNSAQSALSILGPVRTSSDPRVQKLLGEVRARIARNTPL